MAANGIGVAVCRASFAIPRTDHKVLFAERAASKSDPLFGRLACEILGRNASALINRGIVIDRSANEFAYRPRAYEGYEVKL